jgi:hypothetical protein
MGWASVPVARPALGLKIALGVELNGDVKDITDYKPIGTNTGSNRSGSNSRQNRRNTDNAPAPSTTTETFNGPLDKYGGKMAVAFEDHMRDMFRRGLLGKEFQNLADSIVTPAARPAAAPAPAAVADSGGSPYGNGGPYGSGGPYSPGGGGDTDDSGNFAGQGGQGGNPGGGGRGAGNRGGSSTSNADSASLSNPERFLPGVTFYGVDTLQNFQKKAVADGYDALVVFRLQLQTNRNDDVTNDCRILVYKPGDNKAVVSSAQMNNVQVSKNLALCLIYDLDKFMKQFL